MQIDKTYMPRYLDEPYKIAYFTIDEVISLVGAFLLALLIFNSPLYGLVIGACCVALIKKLKGQEGHYFIYHMAYWYFPKFINFRSTPPSHIREILG